MSVIHGANAAVTSCYRAETWRLIAEQRVAAGHGRVVMAAPRVARKRRVVYDAATYGGAHVARHGCFAACLKQLSAVARRAEGRAKCGPSAERPARDDMVRQSLKWRRLARRRKRGRVI